MTQEEALLVSQVEVLLVHLDALLEVPAGPFTSKEEVHLDLLVEVPFIHLALKEVVL